MEEKINNTYSATQANVAKVKWYIINAEKAILGRLSSTIASILRGKNSPLFTPHMNMNHKVVVINAQKVYLTGNKREKKVYFKHTGYIGSERFISFQEIFQKDPTKIIYNAVKGMLPKNKLGRAVLKNLFVYKDNVHPHKAQEKQLLHYTLKL